MHTHTLQVNTMRCRCAMMLVGAEGGIRTLTSARTLRPERSASTVSPPRQSIVGQANTRAHLTANDIRCLIDTDVIAITNPESMHRSRYV